MAKSFVISPQEWTKLAPVTGEDSDLVLSTSEFRMVNHSEGRNGNPIALKQLAADPAHPFTAGEMIVTLTTESTLNGVRDVAHSAHFDHGLFFDENRDAPGVTHQGGLYLADYRVPLEWLMQLYSTTTGMTTKHWLQLNCARPDKGVIDETDRTAASLTIDPDTEEATPADIVLANGTSTPSVEGGVQMRWELTDAQYGLLKPVDADGDRVYKKIGLTLAAASSVAPITYSDYSEAHPGPEEADLYLPYEGRVALKQPATGNWYARVRWPDKRRPPWAPPDAAATVARLSVGE